MSGLSHHPAPHGDKLPPRASMFVLFTPPIAWFVQFCAGVALTDYPCFPGDSRLAEPLRRLGWTRLGSAALSLVAVAVTLGALFVAWRAFRQVPDESSESGHPVGEVGGERTHFIALWGLCLGVGFTVAILLNLVAFAMVPRCAG